MRSAWPQCGPRRPRPGLGRLQRLSRECYCFRIKHICFEYSANAQHGQTYALFLTSFQSPTKPSAHCARGSRQIPSCIDDTCADTLRTILCPCKGPGRSRQRPFEGHRRWFRHQSTCARISLTRFQAFCSVTELCSQENHSQCKRHPCEQQRATSGLLRG